MRRRRVAIVLGIITLLTVGYFVGLVGINKSLNGEEFSQRISKNLASKGFRNFTQQSLCLKPNLTIKAESISFEKGRNLISLREVSMSPDYFSLLLKRKRLSSFTAKSLEIDIQLKKSSERIPLQKQVASNTSKNSNSQSKQTINSERVKKTAANQNKKVIATKPRKKEKRSPYYYVDKVELKKIKVSLSKVDQASPEVEFNAQLSLNTKEPSSFIKITSLKTSVYEGELNQKIPLNYQPRALSVDQSTIHLFNQNCLISAQLGLNSFFPFQAQINTQKPRKIRVPSPFLFQGSLHCEEPTFLFQSMGSLMRPEYIQANLNVATKEVSIDLGPNRTLDFSKLNCHLNYQNRRASLNSFQLYSEEFSLLGNASFLNSKGMGVIRLILSPEAVKTFIKIQKGSGLGFLSQNKQDPKMRWINGFPVRDRSYRDILVRRFNGKTELNLGGKNREWISINTVIARLTHFAIREQMEEK